MQEEWRPVVGWEGLYEVSNTGYVRNSKTGKILKPLLSTQGYHQVDLKIVRHGAIVKRKMAPIHKLVAVAFIPNTDNKPAIDHINTVKTDNCVDNLRWVTPYENSNNPLTKEHHTQRIRETHSTPEFIAKLSAAHRTPEFYAKWEIIRSSPEYQEKISRNAAASRVPVVCLDTGELYESVTEAAVKNGLTTGTIVASCIRSLNQNGWTHSTHAKTPVKHFARVRELELIRDALKQTIKEETNGSDE